MGGEREKVALQRELDKYDTKASKKEDKKAKKPVQEEEAADNGEVAEDLKIQVDLEASKKKYDGRKKMPPKELPRSELEEEKENKPNKPKPEEGKSGNKKKFMVEEEDDKKLLVAPDDW